MIHDIYVNLKYLQIWIIEPYTNIGIKFMHNFNNYCINNMSIKWLIYFAKYILHYCGKSKWKSYQIGEDTRWYRMTQLKLSQFSLQWI
jgi:hypothetical protein